MCTLLSRVGSRIDLLRNEDHHGQATVLAAVARAVTVGFDRNDLEVFECADILSLCCRVGYPCGYPYPCVLHMYELLVRVQ